MRNLLNTVKVDAPGSNMFDLTHDVKLSCKMGDLIPIMVIETIPGDIYHISCETLIRFMPLIAPVMHRMDVTIHYFYVANRLLWDNWEKFITNGGTSGEPGVDVPAHPWTGVLQNFVPPGNIYNYMGVPNPTINSPSINPLPVAAYNKIWNDYYRDENLQAEIDYKLVDGSNIHYSPNVSGTVALLRKRAWEHDYFTSCLPFAQKGAAVEIPIAANSTAPVRAQTPLGVSGDGGVFWAGTTAPSGTVNQNVVAALGDAAAGYPAADSADLSTTGSGTMNDLRTAMRLQEWLEKNARGGTRYTEHLKMHWNVKSSDARLQRAEYITGSKTPVIVSEVLNTTGETDGLPQGNMSGHAISANSGKQGSFYAEEHGFIIGIMSVMPKTAYYQGLHKMWQRFTPTDYPWPSFAHIGEQEVMNNELYVDHTNPTEPFGYIPRYAEYKVMQSRIAGDMQTTLDYWHLARKFAPGAGIEPDLNEEFIQCNPRSDIFAVNDGTDYLVCHVLNNLKVQRKLPVFGTPTF